MGVLVCWLGGGFGSLGRFVFVFFLFLWLSGFVGLWFLSLGLWGLVDVGGCCWVLCLCWVFSVWGLLVVGVLGCGAWEGLCLFGVGFFFVVVVGVVADVRLGFLMVIGDCVVRFFLCWWCFRCLWGLCLVTLVFYMFCLVVV